MSEEHRTIIDKCAEMMFASAAYPDEVLEHHDYDIMGAGFSEMGWSVILVPNAKDKLMFVFTNEPFSMHINMSVYKKIRRTDFSLLDLNVN